MSAIFSDCGNYRYRLDRKIDGSGPPVAFLLHNPSTAGADVDDRTSSRGIGFARLWGCSRLIFVNPWAKIATKPKDLWASPDPVGSQNDKYLADVAAEIAGEGGFVIGAWGRIQPPRELKLSAQQRLRSVLDIMVQARCEIRALGVNRDGSPKHPLYIKKDAQPFRWDGQDSILV